jgi:G3E family GTPase
MAIPVITFTGYLGAGKTTALNALLKTPWVRSKSVALIINEFGSVGVDGKIIEPGSYPKYEINRGSIFCICTKTDFVKYLTEISGNIKPDLLIIEATGIAETRDIESFIKEPHLKGMFKVKANLCILDAVNFTKTAPYFKPVTSQLRWADCVIINKTDLVSDTELERLKALAADYNGKAKIITAERGVFDPGFIDDIEHIVRDEQALETAPEPIFSLSFSEKKKVDEKALLNLIEELGQKLLRLKGNIDFTETDEYFEVVAGEILRGPASANLDKTAFAVIAWQCDKEELQKKFESVFV